MSDLLPPSRCPDCLQNVAALHDAEAEVARLRGIESAAREYVEQQELRREIGRQGRASLGDTSERPVPPDYERLLVALHPEEGSNE